MKQLKRILLVEDNQNDIEMTLEALSEYNLANEIVVTRDGAEAMDYLYRRNNFTLRPEGNPAVILLDIKMPKVDGFEVLKQIKTDTNLKNIPVVLLTSSKEEKDLIESYRLGTNAYVVKPVGFKEFVEAIKCLGVFWAVLNEPPVGSLRK